MLAEGATFAAYEVRRRIAVGGMGEVYLCRHRMLDRLDAVKVLLPHLARDAVFRRRFLREALSAGRLRHPNVVTVYTVEEADGLLYLAMEYLPGEDLGAVLKREGPLDPRRVAHLLRPVADALDAAHRAQLVHRDVKPRNLLLSVGDTAETLTVVDFGISRMLDDDAQITKTGEIVGTIAYCSPEQLSRRPVTGACDQYSLGCVAFECLTGQVPFRREGQLAIMTAHLTAPVPAATAVRPQLPRAADTVLARAMAKDPHDRYATCSHFIAALENAVAAVGARPRHEPGGGGSGAVEPPDDPAALLAAARSGANLARPRGDPDAFDIGLGASAGGAPVRIRLDAGPLAIRGDAELVAGVARWLVAQVIARHDPRHVCLVCAIAPVPGEQWMWLNWLPHARPSTPPISGPHVATTPDAAADLVDRLRAVTASRREDTAQRWPVLVAVLDERLGVPVAEWTRESRAGVHVVHLLRPHTAVPPAMSTLDISPPAVGAAGSPDADAPQARLSGVGTPWTVRSVDQPYVRDLIDLLPD